MRNLFNKICQIFGGWSQSKYIVFYCEDLPLKLEPFKIYLVGEKDDPWQAAFICPCGCRSIIQLSLLKDSNPRWRVFFDKKNEPSLYPSIHRKVGCKSHFFLTRGEIKWSMPIRSKPYRKKSK